MGNEDESLQVVLGYAREQFTRIDVRHESLVSRSTTFLGFLAVFIGLVAAAPFDGTGWRLLSTAGLVLVIVAVGLFVWVTRLKTYNFTPDTAGLVGYVDRPRVETCRQVLANTRDDIGRNTETLKKVQKLYQWAVTLAGLGMMLIGTGVVLALLSALLESRGVHGHPR